jgi:predicted  nucleic acid-binding Zn-ribbon protein
MSVSEDEQEIQRLEQEKANIENQSHNGFADASRFRQLDYEIQAAEERLARERQHPEEGEG